MSKFKGTKTKCFPVEVAGYVCMLDSDDYKGKDLLSFDDVGKEEAIANGNIMAAAPEILEALKGLLNDFKSHIGECDCEPQQAGYIGVAEELIKKVTS